MSMYTDINELDMDLEQYEEQDLTGYEKKKWEKRVLSKLRKQQPRVCQVFCVNSIKMISGCRV